MKVFKLTSFMICLFFLGAAIHVNAESGLSRPIPESQRLIIENNNLSTEAFLSAYMSKNLTERRYAEMYLLGVLDTTEGRVWCDYSHFKTITLGEVIYSGLKNVDVKQRNTRAAQIITDILVKQFPCNGKRP